jgi:hypothetical protein
MALPEALRRIFERLYLDHAALREISSNLARYNSWHMASGSSLRPFANLLIRLNCLGETSSATVWAIGFEDDTAGGRRLFAQG